MDNFFIKIIALVFLFLFWFFYKRTSSWAAWKNHDLGDRDPFFSNVPSPKSTFHLYRFIFLLFSFILLLFIFFWETLANTHPDEAPWFFYLPWPLAITVEIILNKYFRNKKPFYKNFSPETLDFLIKKYKNKKK